MSATTPLVVMITSPLEPEYDAQIAEAFPGEIELIYRDEGGANPAAAKSLAQELIVKTICEGLDKR